MFPQIFFCSMLAEKQKKGPKCSLCPTHISYLFKFFQNVMLTGTIKNKEKAQSTNWLDLRSPSSYSSTINICLEFCMLQETPSSIQGSQQSWKEGEEHVIFSISVFKRGSRLACN